MTEQASPAESSPEPQSPPDQPSSPPAAAGEGGQDPKQPRESPLSEDPPDDMLRPSARRAVVVESVQARVATVGQTHIGSVVINEAGQHYRVPLTELTALHKDMPFAPPPGFADFSPALRSRRVVLAVGPDGCGKEMAVTHALRTNGATTVKLLPADLSVSEMSRVVQARADESDAFVLPGLDEAALRALAGPAGQPIRAAVSAGRVTVAVVTSAEPTAGANTAPVGTQRPVPAAPMRGASARRTAGGRRGPDALTCPRPRMGNEWLRQPPRSSHHRLRRSPGRLGSNLRRSAKTLPHRPDHASPATRR